MTSDEIVSVYCSDVDESDLYTCRCTHVYTCRQIVRETACVCICWEISGKLTEQLGLIRAEGSGG